MLAMSLLKFFKPVNRLPSAEQTGLPEHAVSSAKQDSNSCARHSKVSFSANINLLLVS